jgi:hypothetical protein
VVEEPVVEEVVVDTVVPVVVEEPVVEEVVDTVAPVVVEEPQAVVSMFTINSHGQQITFASGNLQYNVKDDTWRFAATQWEYLGEQNATAYAVNSEGWIDLFGWGTGENPTEEENFATFVDWGVNTIGTDAPHTWRTLSAEEWEYILKDRKNATKLRGVAQVNGVNGLILLPDNWTCPEGLKFRSGFDAEQRDGAEFYAKKQRYTLEAWTLMEEAGAVFLPANGVHMEKGLVDVQVCGAYWYPMVEDGHTKKTKNTKKIDEAGLGFYSNGALMIFNHRCCGLGVRLAKEL